jgi:hypothetical protein
MDDYIYIRVAKASVAKTNRCLTNTYPNSVSVLPEGGPKSAVAVWLGHVGFNPNGGHQMGQLLPFVHARDLERQRLFFDEQALGEEKLVEVACLDELFDLLNLHVSKIAREGTTD